MMSIRWTFLWVMVLLATLQQVSYARNATEVYTPNDQEVSPASRSLQGASLLSNSKLLGDIDAANTKECIPVQGMSITADRWWPFTLKQFESASTKSCFPDRTIDKATGVMNANEAYVTVLKPGAKPWHIQLSSAPVVLEAEYHYTLMYRAKSSVVESMQVALVQIDDCSCNWKVFYAAHPQTTQQYQPFVKVNLSPPATTKYLLNFDLALAPQGTTFSFDDIMLCKQPYKVTNFIDLSPTRSVLLPEASEDFEGAHSKYAFQVAAGKASPTVKPGQGTKGSNAASVSIIKGGTEAWHIQLAGRPVPLYANKKYVVELAMKQERASSRPANRALVTWVQPETWVAVSVESVQLSSEYQVFTLPMVPPKDGKFYLTVDMGLLEGSVLIDYIKVYQLL